MSRCSLSDTRCRPVSLPSGRPPRARSPAASSAESPSGRAGDGVGHALSGRSNTPLRSIRVTAAGRWSTRCGQVIGVNTSGVLTELRDPDGNVVGTGPAQGIFFALAASELANELGRLDVDFSLAAECVPNAASPSAAGSAERGWLLPSLILLLVTAAVLALRARPSRVASDGAAAAPTPPERNPPPVAGPPGDPPALSAAVIRFTGSRGVLDLTLDVAELTHARHGISIGRNGALVDRAMSDPTLSRRHFRVSLDSGRLFVEDLGSTHGTFVNGQRLKPYHGRRLDDGDSLRAGGGEWRFAAKRSGQK